MTPSFALSQKEALVVVTTDTIFESGEIPGSKQEALYGLCAPRESIWLCLKEVIWWALRKLGVEEWIVWVSPGNVP